MLVSGGAGSGGRAADQPHRTGQAHARTVRVGRQRFAKGGDGGRDNLCRLVAQLTVHGADLGRTRGWISLCDITGVCERKRFDFAAHERPDVGRGHQHRRFAFARGGLEGVAHQCDE